MKKTISLTRQLHLMLLLGAGASVSYGKPTTQKLKDELVCKYKALEAKRNQAEHYLCSILSFSQFVDIEHVLQCIKEIDDFFNRSNYGARYRSASPKYSVHRLLSKSSNKDIVISGGFVR